ncbi:MAG: hypothetical protein NTY19_37465 [Planctomycetota bacterium]|nr:hypothetical protein [Planctomycetota bacterium]
MATQDTGYKRLFSHREMVADLLTGFIHEPWVNGTRLSVTAHPHWACPSGQEV